MNSTLVEAVTCIATLGILSLVAVSAYNTSNHMKAAQDIMQQKLSQDALIKRLDVEKAFLDAVVNVREVDNRIIMESKAGKQFTDGEIANLRAQASFELSRQGSLLPEYFGKEALDAAKAIIWFHIDLKDPRTYKPEGPVIFDDGHKKRTLTDTDVTLDVKYLELQHKFKEAVNKSYIRNSTHYFYADESPLLRQLQETALEDITKNK